MDKHKIKNARQDRRHGRVRAKVSGSELRPRLSVFRSNRGMFLQLINDENSQTLVSAHTREIKSAGTKSDKSLELGKLLAEKAKVKGISAVVFDRGCYKYHGRVKAVADGAREGGLQF
jgi:large subunit ribosomal protein L18